MQRAAHQRRRRPRPHIFYTYLDATDARESSRGAIYLIGLGVRPPGDPSSPPQPPTSAAAATTPQDHKPHSKHTGGGVPVRAPSTHTHARVRSHTQRQSRLTSPSSCGPRKAREGRGWSGLRMMPGTEKRHGGRKRAFPRRTIYIVCGAPVEAGASWRIALISRDQTRGCGRSDAA